MSSSKLLGELAVGLPASLTSSPFPGSRRLPHQRSAHQLFPPQLAVTTQTQFSGGIYHPHCESNLYIFICYIFLMITNV